MIPLAFLRTRGGQIVAGVIVGLVLFGAWLAWNNRRVVAEHTAEQQAKAIPANENAAAARVEDAARIATETQQVKDALAPLPDAGLSPRRRAYACATFRVQHPGADTPAACRPGTVAKAADKP